MVGRKGTTRERILYLLKTRGPMTTRALSDQLGISTVAVRQHFKRLSRDNLVSDRDLSTGVGRPARVWSLTSRGNDRFGDGHGELVATLLKNVRDIFGETGLRKLINAHTREQARLYGTFVRTGDTVEQRLDALVERRCAEGYMAEWRRDARGGFRLVERHCPVLAAATSCRGLCRAELGLFRDVLGKDLDVERDSHLLDGDRCCAFRITAAKRADAGS